MDRLFHTVGAAQEKADEPNLVARCGTQHMQEMQNMQEIQNVHAGISILTINNNISLTMTPIMQWLNCFHFNV